MSYEPHQQYVFDKYTRSMRTWRAYSIRTLTQLPVVALIFGVMWVDMLARPTADWVKHLVDWAATVYIVLEFIWGCLLMVAGFGVGVAYDKFKETPNAKSYDAVLSPIGLAYSSAAYDWFLRKFVLAGDLLFMVVCAGSGWACFSTLYLVGFIMEHLAKGMIRSSADKLLKGLDRKTVAEMEGTPTDDDPHPEPVDLPPEPEEPRFRPIDLS